MFESWERAWTGLVITGSQRPLQQGRGLSVAPMGKSFVPNTSELTRRDDGEEVGTHGKGTVVCGVSTHRAREYGPVSIIRYLTHHSSRYPFVISSFVNRRGGKTTEVLVAAINGA